MKRNFLLKTVSEEEKHMRRYYIVSVFGDSKQEIRQISLSRKMVWVLFGFLVVGMTAFPFFLSKYHALKKRQEPRVVKLKDVVQLQKREIQAQDGQIRFFNAEMMRLKTALTRVGQLENHVRAIANIGEIKQENSIFGVGGSIGGDAEDILWDNEINAERLLTGDTRQMPDQIRIPSKGPFCRNRFGKPRIFWPQPRLSVR